MAAVGQKAWLRYDVPGRVMYHARLPLLQDDGANLAVLTPDLDVFVEAFAANNAELRDVQHEVAPGALPPGCVAPAPRAPLDRVPLGAVAAAGAPAPLPGPVNSNVWVAEYIENVPNGPKSIF